MRGVRRRQPLQQLPGAGGIIFANPELRRAHRGTETGDPPHPENVLEAITPNEIVDRFFVENRSRNGDQPCVTCRQNSNKLDVRCWFRPGETVNRIDVTGWTDHDIPGEFFTALWTEHARAWSLLPLERVELRADDGEAIGEDSDVAAKALEEDLSVPPVFGEPVPQLDSQLRHVAAQRLLQPVESVAQALDCRRRFDIHGSRADPSIVAGPPGRRSRVRVQKAPTLRAPCPPNEARRA